MFVALSRFTVANGLEDEVHQAFVDRPRRVEQVDGFVRLDVLRPDADPREFWLITYWTDESSFRVWHKSHDRKASHELMPPGLRLVPGAQEVSTFAHVTD